MYKLLTIVIPCKNERDIIQKTLDLLNYQSNINGVDVIVADSSDDEETVNKLLNRVNDKFKLTITNGGLPAIARNNGFKFVKTPYVLFLDADIFLLDSELLNTALKSMENNNYDLITYRFKTDNSKYKYTYTLFNVIQILSKYISPFCLGGFMMLKSSVFINLGGFNEIVKIGEDYLLSKKIKTKKFKIINKFIFTSSRRLDKSGRLYMFKLLIKTFLVKDKIKYLNNDYNYWGT